MSVSTCCSSSSSGTGSHAVKLQRDLREFIELLNSHGVDFVIVGGYAVAFHGHPRFTGDIDVLLRPSPENPRRVLDVLGAFGFSDLQLDEAALVTPAQVIQLGRPPNRIDLLTSISGVAFDEAWSSSSSGNLDGVPVHFLGREALFKNKLASGRAKDLADVEELRRVKPD
jgi:hypothetical protein